MTVLPSLTYHSGVTTEQSGPTLAERITAWREWARVSKADLADALDVSTQTIRNWEKAVHPPTQNHLEHVVTFLGISLSQFWGPLPPKRDAA